MTTVSQTTNAPAGQNQSGSLRASVDLLDMLICPVCRNAVSSIGAELVCSTASLPHRFPIIDGIPVLINESNSIFRTQEFVERRNTYYSKGIRWKTRVARWVPSLSKNLVSKGNYRRLAELLGADGPHPTALVVGGAVDGVGIAAMHTADVRVISCDASFGPKTDLICDAHDLPFADGTFDACVVQAVLEHVADPYRCVEEICRVLKPTGLVYAETPFIQQVHGGAYDFTRFTYSGHRRLFRYFSELASGVACGPGMALAWTVDYFFRSFFRRRSLQLMASAFARATCFWLPALDYYLVRQPAARDAASGFFFLGRRSDTPLTDRELLTYGRPTP
jgi:SAM-dependent methyltransferase/uncharacterized protein YbaR (Trm112 family)